MARRKSGFSSAGLIDGEGPKAEKPMGLFGQADAYMVSLGYPEGTIREFNLFLGHYCKGRGKPTMDDVRGWVDILERHRAWKYDFDDLSYVLRWCRLNDKYYVAIPPEMCHGGQYWFDKGQSAAEGQRKSKKVYV